MAESAQRLELPPLQRTGLTPCSAARVEPGQLAPSLLSVFAREVHWGIGLKRYISILTSAGRGRLPQKRHAVPHCEEGLLSHTPGGTHGSHAVVGSPGDKPSFAAYGRRGFQALQCALTVHETACDSRVKTTATTTTTTTTLSRESREDLQSSHDENANLSLQDHSGVNQRTAPVESPRFSAQFAL